MKIAICDDNRQELSHILSLLDNYQAKQNLAFTICPFHNSRDLADTLSGTRYDLFLLDIIMPDITGMELARKIRSFDKSADIIFLTTSPEYAVESYTVKATNYLMKPIVPERFYETLDEIQKIREHRYCKDFTESEYQRAGFFHPVRCDRRKQRPDPQFAADCPDYGACPCKK